MPIYVYRCTTGHEFELRQGFDDSAEATCPSCSSQARRKIHSPAVIYKGSGFYTTDYARKKVVPAGESSSSENGVSPGSNGNGKDHGHEHDHGHAHAEPAAPPIPGA